MHIFMGRCPRSEDIAESPYDLFYCITALSLTARYGGATFRKPRFCKEAFHVFLLALYPLLQGVFAVQPPSLQLVLSIQSVQGNSLGVSWPEWINVKYLTLCRFHVSFSFHLKVYGYTRTCSLHLRQWLLSPDS